MTLTTGDHMLRQGFALLAVLAVAPVHAAMIEYGVESATILGIQGSQYRLGETVYGGFTFDDAAPMTSHTEFISPYGIVSSSHYDMSDMAFWIDIGGDRFNAIGDDLMIQWTTTATTYELWYLTLHGDGEEIDG